MIRLLLVFLFISPVAWSQVKVKESALVEKKDIWSQGVVLLKDGRQLKGTLTYNRKTGILTYQNGDIIEPFNARSVQWFELYGGPLGRDRKFYSLGFPHNGYGVMQSFFFEIVKEYKTFSMLRQDYPLDLETISRPSPPVYYGQEGVLVTSNNQNSVALVEHESICFVTASGELFSFLHIKRSESVGNIVNSSRTKYSLSNKKAFEKMVTPLIYKKLKRYASLNGLSFKKESDLISIMEHYSELEQKQTVGNL